jgi:hypothetical protein
MQNRYKQRTKKNKNKLGKIGENFNTPSINRDTVNTQSTNDGREDEADTDPSESEDIKLDWNSLTYYDKAKLFNEWNTMVTNKFQNTLHQNC